MISNAKIEYMGECKLAKELVFLAGSLKKGRYERSNVNIIDQAALKLAIDPINHPRSQGINIQYHEVHKLISDEVLKLDYIPTKEMVADELTKPLTLTKHEYLITMVRLGNKRQK